MLIFHFSNELTENSKKNSSTWYSTLFCFGIFRYQIPNLSFSTRRLDFVMLRFLYQPQVALSKNPSLDQCLWRWSGVWWNDYYLDPIEGDHVAERDDYVDLETSTLHICFSSLQVEFSDQVTHEIEVMAAKSVGNVRNLGKTFGGKAFQKFPQLLGAEKRCVEHRSWP